MRGQTYLGLLLLCVGVLSYGDTVLTAPGYCTTSNCILSASALMRSRDASVAPCKDFYEHACGNWHKRNSPPPNTTTYTTDNMEGYFDNNNRMQNNAFLAIENLLSLADSNKDSAAVGKAKFMYQACLNVALIKERSRLPLDNLLDKLGGFPTTKKNWNETNFSLISAIAKNSLNGYQVFWKSSIKKNFFSQQQYVLTLEEGDLILPRKYLLGKKYAHYRKLFMKYIHDMAWLFGSREHITKDSEDIFNFEIALAKIMSPKKIGTASNMQNYHAYNMRSFRKKVTEYVDIGRFINVNLFDLGLKHQKTVHFVSYAKPSFFTNLGILFQKTPIRVLANYMSLKVINDLVEYLSPIDVGRSIKKFKRPIFGNPIPVKRSDFCTRQTTQAMPYAVARMYVDSKFGKESRAKATKLVKDIFTQFKSSIKSIPWLSSRSKTSASIKLMTTVLHVGYSDELMDDKKLYNRYKNYYSMNSMYFENIASVREQHAREEFSLVGTMVNRNKWDGHAHLVNVNYDPTLNRLTVPAASLQAPLFDVDFPNYLNFAGIGFKIAHELIHSIDQRGRGYGGYGYYRGWWDRETNRRFRKATQCFVDQYSKFRVPEINKKVDGFSTYEDGMADASAIDITFKAYQKYERSLGKKEDMIPVTNTDRYQLFFMNVAQGFCSKIHDPKVWTRLLDSKTSPDKFRVLGSLQNSKDFSKAFKCGRYTFMNPSVKCSMLG